jgi:hypothetical protein
VPYEKTRHLLDGFCRSRLATTSSGKAVTTSNLANLSSCPHTYAAYTGVAVERRYPGQTTFDGYCWNRRVKNRHSYSQPCLSICTPRPDITVLRPLYILYEGYHPRVCGRLQSNARAFVNGAHRRGCEQSRYPCVRLDKVAEQSRQPNRSHPRAHLFLLSSSSKI